MIILINDIELNIEYLNTDFVDYWTSTVFKHNEIISTTFNNEYLVSLKNRYDIAWRNLKTLLETVNELVINHQLDTKFLYFISDKPGTQFLESTHEQWAFFSREALEEHIPEIYNVETNKIYHFLNAELKKINTNTDHINNMVHELEFIYRYLTVHNLSLPSVDFIYGDYVVKPTDTVFGYDSVVVPFMDIGRPQYEKWTISKQVTHQEISNYDRITNYIDFYSTPIRFVPNPKFITQCKNENVPVWGNVLSIGTASYDNFDEVGYAFVNALSDTNRISIKK